MKKFFSGFSLAICAAAIAISCNDSNPKTTEAEGGSDTAATRSNTDVKMNTDTSTMQSPVTNTGGASTSENDFVTKAAGGGMMEVESGKIAQSNAASADVKAFAKMMVADHSKANDELKSIAAGENINMPASLPAEHQNHIDMLKAKTGADFDKAYMDMMVADHDKTVADFKKAAKDNPNEKVKAFAAKTIPTLEAHFAKAKSINAKLK